MYKVPLGSAGRGGERQEKADLIETANGSCGNEPKVPAGRFDVGKEKRDLIEKCTRREGQK